MQQAKYERAELLTEVKRGRHTGTNGTLDQLFDEWIVELERKGRSPNTVRSYTDLYRRNVRPTLGSKRVRSIGTKTLTDLYGAHQKRGLAPASVRKIHATISAMLTQACRWGWLTSNPAQWAEPPEMAAEVPTAPTPEEVARLVQEATKSRRPEYGRLLYLAAMTGMRRGELLALRRTDVDHSRRFVTVSRSLVDLSRTQLTEGPTKNRRSRRVAVDDRALTVMSEQVKLLLRRADELGTVLADDAFLFSDAPDGSRPWRPMMVTRYFGRLRSRAGLDHLTFQSLRRFMDTYGEDLGFPRSQVSLRAGHDPAVAARHYIAPVTDTDRRLAQALENLVPPPEMLD